MLGSSPASALTDAQKQALQSGVHYFNTEADQSCAGVNDTLSAGPQVATTDTQAKNAKIIIGIAKTKNMGQQGALLALMVGIAESHLSILSNSKVPVSLNYPSVEGTGSNYDSVGIFQQRVASGWSTLAPGASLSVQKNASASQNYANGFPDAVFQLMDPAYSAGAFLARVQNVQNWQSTDPWLVAQRVQGSASSDGSVYKAKLSQAQSLLDQYWESAPDIPLPAALGSANNTSTSTSAGTSGCLNISGNLFQTIVKYAWPDYHKPPYLIAKPEYSEAIQAAISRGEYVGGGSHPGIDCGGFITRIMRDSGTDPDYNSYEGNTTLQKKYLDDHPEKYQKLSGVTGTQDLQPGDIAINSTHTYMYVGNIPGFNGNSASASYSSTGESWRSPMASSAYGFTEFTWYRLIGGIK
jgi:hypothetical protein